MLYRTLRPVIFRIPPETAHSCLRPVSAVSSKSGVIRQIIRNRFRYESELLRTNVLGMDFPNPVGLAAGFDKSAELVSLMQLLGFGFIEIGSVTARPCRGNPGKRVMRLPKEDALVNRMGLNNDGADAVRKRLSGIRADIPIGINLAKTPAATENGREDTVKYANKDFLYSFEALYPYSKYIALNLSCPNTPDGKTFEQNHALNLLLPEITKLRENLRADYSYRPILIKLSPDTGDENLADIVKTASKHGINGFVIGNTTRNIDGIKTQKIGIEKLGRCGVSGKPLRKVSTERIRQVYGFTKGKLPIIGCGGVFTAEDAFEKIEAGSSLVQIYTSLIYNGPGAVKNINHGLARIIRAEGLSGIKEAVGRKVC